MNRKKSTKMVLIKYQKSIIRICLTEILLHINKAKNLIQI
jgi:hypothetical protein